MRISIPHCKIRLLVFAVYNLLYVTYMMGYTSQSLYLITLILFCVMNAIILITKVVKYRGIKELKLGLGYVGVFAVISVIMQIYHWDIQLDYLFSGLLRLILPIVNGFFIVNTVEKREQKYFFDVLLLRFIIHFIWQNYGYFNVQGLLSISWLESQSAMESSIAHDFIIMEMYYLWKKDNKKALLCMVLCMLSMKRLSFVLAGLLYICARFIPRGVAVKKKYLDIAKGVTIISPFIILFLYLPEVQNWLLDVFHIELNKIMLGRPRIYEILKNNIPYYNGYGSINDFLSQFVFNQYGTTWNGVLHNDFLRIYLETTILGVIVLANNLFELSKKDYWHFIMVLYLILVAITSHILNYFSVWVTLYMIVMCTEENSEMTKVREQIN